MRYTKEFYQKVLNATDIVNVIGRYTKLTKYDELYNGDCPLHQNSVGGLVADPKTQTFHCFECGEGGNAAIFLMKKHGINMDQAIDFLAKKAHIQPTQNDMLKNQNQVLKETLYDIYKDTAIYYSNQLKTNSAPLAYLEERGINDRKTIASFGLGYSPTKGNALYKYLHKKGYPDEVLEKSGLVKFSEYGPYDMFRGRLMFPIMDDAHRVIAFGGRTLDPDGKPKYLNSAESLIFNKSKTLYGMHDIPQHADQFLLCEGYMDVIRLHQAGFKNAVATLGTAFTPMHIPIIKQHTNNLVLTFDSDAAGIKAAKRTINVLSSETMGVKVLSMTPCKDPDEFIQMLGRDEFQTRIDRSVSHVDFQLQALAKDFDLTNEKEKDEYIKSAINLVLANDKNREIHQLQNMEISR